VFNPERRHNSTITKCHIIFLFAEKGGEFTSSVISGKHVLLIIATQKRAEQIRSLLRNNGVDSCIASTIYGAVSQMMIRTFDVVALDTDVEDASRLIRLLLDLRHAKSTLLLLYPIEDSDIRAGFLNRGFDMCLPSSNPKECSAAICSLLRRPSIEEYPTETAPPGRVIYKELTIDPLRQKVLMAGREVTLTALEFKLLYFLASNPSIVFSKDLIYERVWRENSFCESKSVTNLISSIRKKLGLTPDNTEYIKTVKGVGYCFAP